MASSLEKITIFAWACNMHAFTGLLTPDFTMHQHQKPPITSAFSHGLSYLAQNLYIHTFGPSTNDSLLLGDKTTHLCKHCHCFATAAFYLLHKQKKTQPHVAAYSLSVCANIPGTELSNLIPIKNTRHSQQVK
jgi:hypothetical protein